jgi:thiamine-monophosphate kinase
MDLSDGLAQDLPRLAAASGCGACLEAALIPGVQRLDWRVGFGEDYQLLFTAPPEARNAIASLAVKHGISITRIGCLTEERSILLSGDGWPSPLFNHFQGGTD